LIINKLRYLEKFMNRKQVKRIVTFHSFGMLYYASPVRSNKGTSSVHWKTLNSPNNLVLLTAVKDHKRQGHNKDLSSTLQRAAAVQWMKITCCQLDINLYNLGKRGTPSSTELQNVTYINDRQPGKAYFRDSSKIKIGHHHFVNFFNCIRDKPSTGIKE